MPQPLRAVTHTSDLAAGYLKHAEVPSTRNASTAFEKAALEAGLIRNILELNAGSKSDGIQEFRDACDKRMQQLGYARGATE